MERPSAVVLNGERLEVIEIEDRWISTGVDPASAVVRGFIVRCRGGARFRLIYNDEWGWKGELLPGPRSI